MWVTIVHTSDDGARVHKAGCADIKRRETKRRDFLSAYTVEVDSKRKAALDAWSDFVAEESMTEDGAMCYTDFLPCTEGLK